MRTSRSDGQATRRRILRVATSLFASGGYEATSLRQIATAADVDLATLKYHFGDKPSLFAEVYRAGHDDFVAVLAPVLADMFDVQDDAGLDRVIGRLVRSGHDFAESHLPFVRMVLYRLLEESSDTILVEEELQVLARGMIERAFEGLAARGVIKPVDTRAFGTFVVTAMAQWLVTSRLKPSWVGSPALGEADGRVRSEAFWCSLLKAALTG